MNFTVLTLFPEMIEYVSSISIIGRAIKAGVIEVLPVNSHVKRGKFVSAHLHLNVTYLLQADDSLPIRPKPDENSAVAWLPLREAAENREEPFMTVIYRKLNQKLDR